MKKKPHGVRPIRSGVPHFAISRVTSQHHCRFLSAERHETKTPGHPVVCTCAKMFPSGPLLPLLTFCNVCPVQYLKPRSHYIQEATTYTLVSKEIIYTRSLRSKKRCHYSNYRFSLSFERSTIGLVSQTIRSLGIPVLYKAN